MAMGRRGGRVWGSGWVVTGLRVGQRQRGLSGRQQAVLAHIAHDVTHAAAALTSSDASRLVNAAPNQRQLPAGPV